MRQTPGRTHHLGGDRPVLAGPVGTGGCNRHGYIKNYKYDERLKYDQPPDFLTPSSTELKLARVTAPPNGFGEG